MIRSPSQWPGTARSAASAGRWLMLIMSGIRFLVGRPGRLRSLGRGAASPAAIELSESVAARRVTPRTPLIPKRRERRPRRGRTARSGRARLGVCAAWLSPRSWWTRSGCPARQSLRGYGQSAPSRRTAGREAPSCPDRRHRARIMPAPNWPTNPLSTSRGHPQGQEDRVTNLKPGRTSSWFARRPHRRASAHSVRSHSIKSNDGLNRPVHRGPRPTPPTLQAGEPT